MIDISVSAGWTLDYVENAITLSRVRALYAYWRKNPPVHKLIARFVGYQPPSDFGSVAPAPASPSDAADPSGIGPLLARSGFKPGVRQGFDRT